MTLVIRNAEVDGDTVSVLIAGGRVVALGSRIDVPAGSEVIDAVGGALLPGLHDHHLHVLALAAARASIACGPPDVRDGAGLAVALRAAHASAAAGAWLRGVGFHESVAPAFDRHWIDAVVRDRPVRVQHRSGAQWIVNTAALDLLGPDVLAHAGTERDPAGTPTGRLTGMDHVLRGRWSATGAQPAPDVGAVARELAGYGVTGLTDATPYATAADLAPLLRAHIDGALPQRLVVTGSPTLRAQLPSTVCQGPAKIVVGDHDLPDWDQLVALVRAARERELPVAVHCVTRVGLVLTLAVLAEVGTRQGDRIEHAAVADEVASAQMAQLGLTVVTQPNFIAERGDRYRVEVDPGDVDHLYACGSLMAAGVDVGGSTDAPFGHPDPWRAMRSAVERTTADGTVLGGHERIDGTRALGLFLGPLDAPGGPARRVDVGCPASLCLLRVPLRDAVTELSAGLVAHTVIGGTLQLLR